MWFPLFAAAHAAEPTVSTDDAGVVRAAVVVAATPDAALALVRDPKAVHALGGEGSTLVVTPDGSCFRIDYAMATAIANVAYIAKACPTDQGFRTDLVTSEAFRSMSSEWTVRPVAAGTEVTYTYKADVALPVPGFIVRRSTQNAIAKMMAKVAGHLER